jgi:16S rRNA (adenine1518-N6/adenine1519-N6)-dimethyltransferase
VAAAIVRAARVGPGTDVLEVGPGLGILTHLLVRQARRVVAVELDRELADALEGLSPKLTMVNADILKVDPADFLAESYTVVANLPYHITSPVLRHLLNSGPPFVERLVVMVQAEVARRIAAEPGEMSALSVAIQSQARVEVVRRVPSEAFYPRPKVDSAVLLLEPLHDEERAVSRKDLDDFVKLVQTGFKQPRKTVANSLADGLGVTRPEAMQQLAAVGIEPSLRPQALTVEDWVRLFAES